MAVSAYTRTSTTGLNTARNRRWRRGDAQDPERRAAITTRADRGSPASALRVIRAKGESVEIRLTEAEKVAFRDAADIAGIGLTTWMRERLRRVAVKELEEAGLIAAFLERGV
jgi:hypothetical protein